MQKKDINEQKIMKNDQALKSYLEIEFFICVCVGTWHSKFAGENVFAQSLY